MAILDDTDIICVERCRSSKKSSTEIELDLGVGSRLPAYCTSMGKAVLAHLPAEERTKRLDNIQLKPHGPTTLTERAKLEGELDAVRKCGIAVNEEELAFGIRAIAAPVRGSSGNVVASIGFGVHRSWLSMDDLVRELAPLL